MQVKTLIGQDFVNACLEIASKVSSDYSPDLVVGVLTGGGYVGRKVFDALPNNAGIKYVETKIQRESTVKKENPLVKFVLKHSPYFLLNWMRMIESNILEKKSKKENPKRVGKIELDADTDSLLKKGNVKVLLVDDAIDTGATLKLLYDYIVEKYSNVEVRIAVVTVTMGEPLIDADYSIFHNRTLVRFPWSNDVKSK